MVQDQDKNTEKSILRKFNLIAGIFSILGGIFALVTVLKSLLKIDIKIAGNIFLAIFYVSIWIIARRKYGIYNFLLTTTLKYRFFFATVFVIYIWIFNDSIILKALVFAYLIYCLSLSYLMSKSNYFEHRETRTIIDAAFVFIFCSFHGDPINIFYFLLFIPIAVSARYYDEKGDMFVWITSMVVFYILTNIIYLKNFAPIGEVDISPYQLVKLYYLKVLMVYMVSFVYWAQRRKNNFENKIIYNVLNIITKKSPKLNSILEFLCKQLNIQLAIIIHTKKSKLDVVNGYSDLDYTIDKKECNLEEMGILNRILDEVDEVGKMYEDYDENLKNELKEKGLISEEILPRTINFHFLCVKLLYIKNINEKNKYFLLLINKLASKNNRRITKKFSPEEREIVERISHLLHSCIDSD